MSTEVLQRHLASIARLAPLIEAHADSAEQLRRLPPPVVRALVEAGLFKLYLPRSLGGSELEPLEFAECLEAISRIDGSAGWCAFIGNVNTLFTSPMVPASIETIFANQPEVVTGSAFFPFGRALRCEGGHRVTGRWQFASGCQHCSWYFVLCQEYDGDTPLFHDHGAPRTRACFVPISSYTIEETWDVSGLAGSGSHDVILDDVFVPEDMSWPFGRHMRPDARHFSGPLYRYPSYATGVMQAGFIAIGIAQGAIDRAVEIAQTKTGVATTTTLRDRPTFHIGLAEAVALVRGSRAWLKDALREFGAFIAREEEVSFEARANMLLAATKAVHNCARATDIMFTLSGANANYKRNPLQRSLRDAHAATQHFAVAINQVESAGRMMLGLEPLAPPVILS
jgi:alkylation response protein AidB-like acyl-CoA dehydrogenase